MYETQGYQQLMAQIDLEIAGANTPHLHAHPVFRQGSPTLLLFRMLRPMQHFTRKSTVIKIGPDL